MSRHPRVLRADAGGFRPWLESWQLAMSAGGMDARTIEMYIDVAVLLAGWLVAKAPKVRDWDQVGVDELRRFFVWLQAGGRPCPHQLDPKATTIVECAGYGRSYANNIGRGLQQWFAWYAHEEGVPDPMNGFKIPAAPKPGDKLVPVLEEDELRELIQDAERGRGYSDRRDAAVLRLESSTGIRLAELAGLDLADINLQRREAAVTGKGGKQRIVKFDGRTALALDRYLRMRNKRLLDQGGKMAADAVNALWIGHRRFVRMTEKGLYQAIVRRGKKLGIEVWPHKFRHTFSHRFLDAGGSEGDLMELNGWDSEQMLRHYGRSARNARARRAYDRVNVMGDI